MLTDVLPVNLVVAGVGGQGNVLVSQLLGRMMQRAGLSVTIGETYGASQRGGSVMSHVRLSRSGQVAPLIPEGKAHLIVGLEPSETLRVLGPYGHPDVLVLSNTRAVQAPGYPPLDTILGHIRDLSQRSWTIDATDLALGLGDAILANMIMLGALSTLALLPFDREAFSAVAREVLPHASAQDNLRAFDLGARSVQP